MVSFSHAVFVCIVCHCDGKMKVTHHIHTTNAIYLLISCISQLQTFNYWTLNAVPVAYSCALKKKQAASHLCCNLHSQSCTPIYWLSQSTDATKAGRMFRSSRRQRATEVRQQHAYVHSCHCLLVPSLRQSQSQQPEKSSKRFLIFEILTSKHWNTLTDFESTSQQRDGWWSL